MNIFSEFDDDNKSALLYFNSIKIVYLEETKCNILALTNCSINNVKNIKKNILVWIERLTQNIIKLDNIVSNLIDIKQKRKQYIKTIQSVIQLFESLINIDNICLKLISI